MPWTLVRPPVASALYAISPDVCTELPLAVRSSVTMKEPALASDTVIDWQWDKGDVHEETRVSDGTEEWFTHKRHHSRTFQKRTRNNIG